jgi:peptidoglycan/xylan/chitin deacetylase (PgdA/CDA1 family)
MRSDTDTQVAAPWLVAGNRLLHGASAHLGARRLPILIFHRVQPQADALFPGEMHAARFDALVRMLAGAFRIRTLGEAAARLADGTLEPRTLVITFDDGYADNAEVALPILRRHGVAASFFVSTGFLDGGRMWNDTVIEAFRATRVDSADLACVGLGRLPLGDLAQRRSAIGDVLPRVKYLPLAQREEVLAQLLQALGQPPLPAPPMMRSAQVGELARAGMEIGGHTVRHPILTELDESEAEAEIAQGRSRLAELAQREIEVFAYPNGVPGRDYDARHVGIVRKLGFKAAVSTAPGAARCGADLLQLPRFTPWDRDWARWSARLWWETRRDAAATAPVQGGPM